MAILSKDAKIPAVVAKGTVTESKSFRDGLIYLYKRGDYKKPTWLCRIKVPNTKGYINRSTGTGDEHQAFKFADDLYHQLLVKSLTPWSWVAISGSFAKLHLPHRSRRHMQDDEAPSQQGTQSSNRSFKTLKIR